MAHCLIGAKTKKIKSEIIQNLQSHYLPYGNVQIILLKFKMANTSPLFKYLWQHRNTEINWALGHFCAHIG